MARIAFLLIALFAEMERTFANERAAPPSRPYATNRHLSPSRRAVAARRAEPPGYLAN